MSTIVAIATALGAGGIGIVRLSGEDALQIANGIFAVVRSSKKEMLRAEEVKPEEVKPEEVNPEGIKPEGIKPEGISSDDKNNNHKNIIEERNFCTQSKNIEESRNLCTQTKNAQNFLSNQLGQEPSKLIFGEVRCSEFSDKGYAVYFKAPNSFTGEDVVEFQIHGGVRILDGIVRECVKHGAVPAQKGEFTKRAFLNGKMTLADAEGVVDMINAESASAVRAAYKLMDGEFGKQMKTIEARLFELICGLEASLDFPDEMEDEVLPQTPAVINGIISEIDSLIQTADEGRIAKHGLKIVLVGSTNVGKSSLMNAILKRERAIVTATAGTTRDLVSESIEYKGVKFNLVDTAGIRESEDEIEQIGVKRAKDEIKSADLVLYVKDASASSGNSGNGGNSGNSGNSTQNTIQNAKQQSELEKLFSDKVVFIVENKSDKRDAEYGRNCDTFKISAKFSKGINVLLDAIYEMFKTGGVESGEVVTSERHLSALARANDALENAINGLQNNSTDCTLIDLKCASDALGEITGTTASEEIIEQIFSRFCVGK
ncbi:MAG: tRNA uridine-5-carboxymethylaminomethyl(34) synthesis GTPase MnmE [Clostridia bacterium]|nr:tRNA uridine-5-carboxymethylaminomethyl(34) synthesis GTPase MnmE [Clostridia bacterium]